MYRFDNFQNFLNKSSVNGDNSLAIHGTVCFARKNYCVSPSEGMTVKYFHGNKFSVIDVFESNNYSFEVILKYYDESTSEIKEMK